MAYLLATAFDITQATPISSPHLHEARWRVSTPEVVDRLRDLTTARVEATANILSSRDITIILEKRNDKAAVVGGTIATVLIVVILGFVLCGIYKQCMIRRELKAKKKKQHDKIVQSVNEKPNGRKDHNLTEQALRRCFPNAVEPSQGDPSDTGSVFTEVSTADSRIVQIGARDRGPPVPPKIPPAVPPKVASVSGGYRRSERAPQLPDHQSPGPIIEEHDLHRSRDSSRRRGSACTMSGLGMALLRDTMQDPKPERYESPPGTAQSWTPGHQRTPGQDLNTLVPKQPSRRYFRPLLSPTSPGANQGSSKSSGGSRQLMEGGKTRRSAEKTVERDSMLGPMFSMGDNKF